MPRFLGTARYTRWGSVYGRLFISFVPRSQGLWGWAKYIGPRTPQGSGYFLVSRKLLFVIRRQVVALHPLKQTD